jgi:hypothetical protein
MMAAKTPCSFPNLLGEGGEGDDGSKGDIPRILTEQGKSNNEEITNNPATTVVEKLNEIEKNTTNLVGQIVIGKDDTLYPV